MTTADDLNRVVEEIDNVIITAELARRPSRPPDYAAENQALTTLAEEVATNPGGVLQKCAELVMELCRAGSAGISLLEPGGEHGRFRWQAIVGAFAGYWGGTVPREASPCGVVIARDSVLLFQEAERFFPALKGMEPRAYETLLVPWHRNGRAVGTLWAIKHTPDGRFDAEDARLLQSLAHLAAAASQMSAALGEAKAGQEALRESEERFRSLVEGWAQAVWKTDAEGKVITDSPSWRTYTGQSLEEYLGSGWANAIHPDDRAAVQRLWREAVRGRRSLNAEYRLRQTDGGWRWTNVHAAPLLAPDGTVRKWVGMNIDITERKQAEDALRASEERFQYCARATRDIIWDIDLLEDRVWESEALQTQMGYAPEAIGPDTAWCLAHIHPDDRERVVQGFKQAAEGTGAHWSDEYRYQRADGSYAYIVYRGFILRNAQGKAVRMIGAMQDITERQQAEEALRASEERQAFLLKLSDALRPLEDPYEIQREASRVLREHLGGDRVVYWEALSDEEMMPAGADYAADATRYNGTYRLSEYGPDLAAAYRAGRVVSRDDPASDPHLSDNQRAAFSADRTGGWAGVPLVKRGHLVALLVATFPAPHAWSPTELALMDEVAERTWAAVERARAETAWRRFATLAEASGEFIGMCDMQLVPFYVNAAGLRLVGLDSLNEVQHTPVLEFFFPEDQALIRDEFLPRVLREGGGEIEIRFRHFKSGEALWVIYSVVALTDEHGKPSGYGTVTRDITERKKAEEALRASESRARLLLGELQHRVRNTLSVIRSITRRTAETSRTVEDYAMHLDGRINAFARVQTAVARDPAAGLDLNELVADELLTYAAHQGGQVRITGPSVRLNPKAAETFGLAIHELATNAVKHGALTIPNGRIRISWQVQNGTDPHQLVFEWKESGTPNRAAKRKRRGFGTDLLERTLTYELKAKTVQTFEQDGLRCTIELPMTERFVISSADDSPQQD